MRIAILAPPWFAVPPTGYGGIEWIVWLLADGLIDRGHEVTLFASGDSRTKATLRAVFEHAPSELIGRSLPELRHVLSCYERAEEFDVVNDHTGHLGAALGGLSRAPVVHTVHGPLDGEPGSLYQNIEMVAPPVGLEAEQDLEQQHGRPGRPGLGPRRRRIGDRERRLVAREACEDLGQLVVEVPGRGEHVANDSVRLGPARVAREPPGDQRVVMGPDSPVVVRERVEAAVGR